MLSRRLIPIIPFALTAVGACGGGEADPERDLNLPPAESISAIGDTALAEAQSEPAEPEGQPARPPPPPRLDEGKTIMLAATDTVELNNDAVGETITATVVEGLYDTRGREVIPAGAMVYGTLQQELWCTVPSSRSYGVRYPRENRGYGQLRNDRSDVAQIPAGQD